MQEFYCSLKEKRAPNRRFWLGLIDMLLLGILLGALGGAPYAEWFGLSHTLQLAVRSMVSVSVLTGFLSHPPTSMRLEQACFL